MSKVVKKSSAWLAVVKVKFKSEYLWILKVNFKYSAKKKIKYVPVIASVGISRQKCGRLH